MVKKMWLVVALVGAGLGVTGCPSDGDDPLPDVCNFDNRCTGEENVDNCPEDCGVTCGNNACEVGETAQSCAQDCVKCGDNVCDATESTQSCAADCKPPCNNNAVCDANEEYETCSADCAAKLRVQNSSSYAIYYLYVKRCTDSSWGQNQLSPYILYTNQSFTLGSIPPGCYNFKANNSNFSLTWTTSAGVNLVKGALYTWTLFN